MESLSRSLAAAYSQQRIMTKRAGFTAGSMRLRGSIDDCAHLESEHYMQMQQAFCLQVPLLAATPAASCCTDASLLWVGQSKKKEKEIELRSDHEAHFRDMPAMAQTCA